MDVAQAQALLGPPGRLHQIDVLLVPGADAGGGGGGVSRRGSGPVARVAHARAAGRRGRGAARRVPAEPHRALARQPASWAGSWCTPARRPRSCAGARSSASCAAWARRAGRCCRLVLAEACAARHRRHGAGDPARLAGGPGSTSPRVSATLQNLYLLEGIEPRHPHARAPRARGACSAWPARALGARAPGARRGRVATRARSSPRSPCDERARRAGRPLSRCAGLAVLALAAPWPTPCSAGAPDGRASLVALGVLAAASARRPLVVLRLGSRRAGRPAGSAFAYGARTLALHLRSSAVAVGRAGGVGRHARRHHRHGRAASAAPWIGWLDRHPARRRLRHHALLAPRPGRHAALGAGPGRAGSPAVPEVRADGPPAPAPCRWRGAPGPGGGRRRRPCRTAAARVQRHRRRRGRRALRRVRDGAALVSEPLARRGRLSRRRRARALGGPGGPVALPVAGRLPRVRSGGGRGPGRPRARSRRRFGPGPSLQRRALPRARAPTSTPSARRLRGPRRGERGAVDRRSNRTLRAEVMRDLRADLRRDAAPPGDGPPRRRRRRRRSRLLAAGARAPRPSWRSTGRWAPRRSQVFRVFAGTRRSASPAAGRRRSGLLGGAGARAWCWCGSSTPPSSAGRCSFTWPLAPAGGPGAHHPRWPRLLAPASTRRSRASDAPATELSRDALYERPAASPWRWRGPGPGAQPARPRGHGRLAARRPRPRLVLPGATTGRTPATGTSGGTSPGLSAAGAEPARRFGYQVTFFRIGPVAGPPRRSARPGAADRRWLMGHVAVDRPRDRRARLLGGALPGGPAPGRIRRPARSRASPGRGRRRAPSGAVELSPRRRRLPRSTSAIDARGLALRPPGCGPVRPPVLQGPDGVSAEVARRGATPASTTA